jgi:hypothetical protein
MPAPVNVKLEVPSITIRNWDNQATLWRNLNTEIGGNSDFFPLTIKSAYVIGIIHDICTCTELLLHSGVAAETTYLPAFGLFSSGIELIGRCVNGNKSHSGSPEDLITGFKWLSADKNYIDVKDSDPIVTTMRRQYNAENLANLRNYSAHGQAMVKGKIESIDTSLLGSLSPLLAKGLSVYWNTLINEEYYCNKLAEANVLPFRNHPIGISWVNFERDESGEYHSIFDIFNEFNFDIFLNS